MSPCQWRNHEIEKLIATRSNLKEDTLIIYFPSRKRKGWRTGVVPASEVDEPALAWCRIAVLCERSLFLQFVPKLSVIDVFIYKLGIRTCEKEYGAL